MASDMAALRELIARVQVGTRVEAFSHGVNEGRRSGVVTRLSDDVYGSGKAGYHHTLDKVVSSQGRAFRAAYGTWPVEGDDFEIVGNTLRKFHYSAYAGGRAVSVEVTFTAAQF